MATKIWTTKADFDTGILSDVVDHRNNDLQLACAWSSAADLNTARMYIAGCGTQIAGLSFGGYDTGYLATTEEYNGSSWSSVNNLNTARRMLAGAGTQTAGLSFGGFVLANSNVTEEYNGTIWSAVNNLNAARQRLGGCGTQTAALSFGGYIATYEANTEEYDETSWCSAANLNTARYGLAGCGTQTAGLSFGGLTGGSVKTTEEYNGSSWSSVGDLNKGRYHLAGCGSQTSGLSFGGSSGEATEEYNGSLWFVGGNLNEGRERLAGAGIQTSGLSFGGYAGGTYVTTTEEYNLVSIGTWTVDFDSGFDEIAGNKTSWDDLSWLNAGGGSIKARVKSATTQSGLGAWASGGDLNTARRHLAGAGTQVAGLSFGGDVADAVSGVTEGYDSTSWCSEASLNTARKELGSCGTQLAGLSFGGYTTEPVAVTEEYNGTSWSSGGSLNIERRRFAGCGTQTAGLSFGGENDGGTQDITEEYDGTSWFSGGSLNLARRILGAAGTQTAGLSFGGYDGLYRDETEEYDGTSWCAGGNLNLARYGFASCGTQTQALSAGGYTGVNVATTEEYDGTIWGIGGNLNTEKRNLAGCGTQNAGLSFGGYTSADVATTEEYTTEGVWYPEGSEYTTQPVDVECPDNRWYRLELSLVEGSTPQIEQVGQGYTEPWPTIIGNANIQISYPSITGNGKIQPILTANSEISLNVLLYADGRIQPIISADGKIQPVISSNAEICLNVSLNANARIQPVISSNAEICLNVPLYAVARIQSTISGDGRISPIINANGRILYMLMASGRISPIITASAVIFPNIRADGRIRPVINADGRIRPGLIAVGRIQPTIYANGRIRPIITSNGEIVGNIPLYAVARIHPVITANGNIIYVLLADGRIQPVIISNSRIRPVITASAIIAPSIGGNAEIISNIPLYANARIRLSNYSSYTINAHGRIFTERRTKLFISSDVKENILLYQRYQDLRGLVVDENFYTRDGHVVPRKRGRTNFGKYLFALQSPFFAQTVWSVSLNSSYQFDILTDVVGIASFRMALARGENRIDVTRKETKVELLEIHPTTRTNITPLAKTASMIQKETFVIKDVSGQKTRLLDSEYSFVTTSYIKIASSAYDASATYTIYYVVINPGETEPEERTYTTWVRSLNYVTWFGAYSEELMSIDDSSDETEDDTYLKTATHQSLVNNFGATLARTEPDSKWTVDGYREVLEEYYHSYLRSSTTQKGVKDGVGNIVTIPPKLESYQNYKKWILGWQWLPNRELYVNPISGFPDGWTVVGGTCEDDPNNKLFGYNALKITVSSGATEVIIESNAISTWKRFINRNWRLRGWLCKESGPTLGVKLGISEDGGNSWNWNSQTLTSTYKRFTFPRHVSKYATNIRIRFKITGAVAGKIIYLNWPSLEEMRDKCLHVGSSSYYPEIMNYIPATYVNAYTFTVGGNRVSEFTYLRDIRANCGVDDIKYGKVSQSSYVVATDITTVLLTTSVLTSNLTDVKFTVNSVYWSTVPRSKAKSYHGFRVFCWGIHTLTEQEKKLVGFISSGGINIMNPGTGHPFYIKSAEAILELVEEEDYRIYSSYDNLKAGQKTNMEVVKREDIV